MKTTLKYFSAFVLLSAINYAQVTESFNVNIGGKIIINSSYGDVLFSTWNKSEVRVVYEGEENESDDVIINKDGNTIKFNAFGSYSGDIEINVPSLFNCEFKLSAGDFILKNELTGSISGSTGGGDILLKKVKGSVRIRTSGGDLEADNITGDAEFYSAGGDITIGEIGGRTKISTGGGSIAVGSIGSDASVSTAGGNIIVGDVRGQANVNTLGGNISLGRVSGKVSAYTSGGNISIKSASGSVNANTGSGDVKLYNVTGQVNVNAASGRVEVHLNPAQNSNSVISTTIGDLVLYIPSNAKATISATTTYKGWRKNEDKENPQLTSDYPQSSYTVNKDRRQAVAEYILNGGGSSIRLNAAMGRIKIKQE
ncbi:MAG: DUF4097 domain-containing protein [Ignavibacteriaceae bacterium]|nr:DUF4097 domain-containing protein [Ignavibacteriaceae bacterium]